MEISHVTHNEIFMYATLRVITSRIVERCVIVFTYNKEFFRGKSLKCVFSHYRFIYKAIVDL